MSEPDAPTPPAMSEIELACPICGQGVAVALRDSPQMLVCPNCGHEFVAPALDGATEIAGDHGGDEAGEAQIEQVPMDMLTAVRIRELAAERRATYRAGSYCLIAAGVCAVTIAQLTWMIAQHLRVRHGWGIQCTGYLLFIALALYGLVYFFLQARRLHREARQSSLREPTTPPDFSTLDDGSKRVANLEDVR